jgi:tripartite ATP-independent transporter DctP family solute receptor
LALLNKEPTVITRRALTGAVAAGLALPAVRRAHAAQRLRLGIGHPITGGYGAAARAFAAAVRDGTDGRYVVEIFADGALGSEEAMLGAVRAGTLDLTIVASGLLGTWIPEVGLFDLPFLFRSADHARSVLDGPVGTDYAKRCRDAGIPVIGWAENGTRHLTANRPIRNATELRGLKLRIMPAPLLLQSFRSMGADAASLSMTQLYEALRLGQFEAEENPVPIIIASQVYEVQTHLSMTAHTYSAACVAISQDLLEDIGPAETEAFMRGARDAVTASREFVIASERSGMDFLPRHGMAVVTDIDRESFLKAAGPAYALAASQFGADKLAQLRGG